MFSNIFDISLLLSITAWLLITQVRITVTSLPSHIYNYEWLVHRRSFF